MAGSSTVKLTINFNDPEADASEREREVQSLLKQLKDLDEIESVGRVPDPNPPAGNKSIGGFLVGILTAEIKIENFTKLMGLLSHPLAGKPIELEVEANGKKIKLKANSPKDFEAAVEAAKDLVKV